MKILIHILFLVPFISVGQTNIDTSFMGIQWFEKDTVITKLRDGEAIIFAPDFNIWTELCEKRQPAYCFYDFDQTKSVLYNFEAVKKGIAPFGYKIPSQQDYFETNILQTKNLWSPDGYLEGSGCAGVTAEEDEHAACTVGFGCMFQYENEIGVYWSSESAMRDSIHDYHAMSLWKYPSTNQLIPMPIHEYSGAKARFVRNYNEVPPAMPNRYSILRPAAFKIQQIDLCKAIADLVPYEQTPGMNKINHEFELKLAYNSSGQNISSSLNSIDRKKEYLKVASREVNSLEEAPMFQGETIACSDVIGYRISVYSDIDWDTIKPKIPEYIKLNEKINKALSSDYLTYKSDKRDIEFNSLYNQVYDHLIENREYLLGVKGRGPFNGLGIILPGMGYRHVTRRNGNGRVAMIAGSIISGVTCLTSKLLSNHFHGQYRSYPTHDQTLYNKSNTFQRIFIVSGGVYGALMLVDLTATFVIGSKNKKAQHNINKFINDDYPNGLRID